MAKLSSKFKNLKRILKSTRAKVRRDELRALSKVDSEEGDAARLKLNKRPRDESPIRIRDRCQSCSRPNGTYRKFRLCRMCLRKAVMRGDVPGMRKASW